jgi:hypothetical protein
MTSSGGVMLRGATGTKCVRREMETERKKPSGIKAAQSGLAKAATATTRHLAKLRAAKVDVMSD